MLISNLGLILQARGEVKEALSLFQQEEEICRNLKLMDQLQRCVGKQAIVYASLGKPNLALPRLKEAERICRQIVNKKELITSLSNQSTLIGDSGDYHEALRLNEEVMVLREETQDLAGMAQTLIEQVVILVALGRLNDAIRQAELA